MTKKYFIILPLVMSAFLAMSSQSVSAHETRMYEIKHQLYQFVVGSLNEPIAVDDKTGVHLIVTKPGAVGHKEEAGHDEVVGAVAGLDKTLKVEISAGDKKKILELTPIHGEVGAYRASFIPTIQTTYTYRFFGTVNDTPINVSFSCNPAGHPATPEDKTEVELSEGVHQTLKRGAFGCPAARADLGFPEQSASTYDMVSAIHGLDSGVDNSTMLARVSLLLGGAGLGLSLILLKRGRM